MMRTAARLGLTLTLLAACGGDDNHDESHLDASVPLDSTVPLIDASPRDATVVDGALDAYVPPTQPKTFSLEVSAGSCGSTCPEYSLTIDEAGKVSFHGGVCTARPGKFEKQLTTAAARSAYDAFVNANYWSFGDRYASVADRCSEVWVDTPTNSFDARVDGFEKRLVHDQGCKGVAKLAKLDDLRTAVVAAGQVQDWIGDALAQCGYGDGSPWQQPLEGASFTLRGESVIGTLHIDAGERRFTLTGCDGATIAEGAVSSEWVRAVLTTDSSTSLPGVGDFASIVLSKSGTGWTAQALGQTRDVTLTLTPGSGC